MRPLCKNEALVRTEALSEQHGSDCCMPNQAVGWEMKMQEATSIQFLGFQPF